MAKQRTPEQWQDLIQQQKQSGLSIAQFCLENHLSKSYFFLQLKKFKQAQPESSAFVAAKSVAQPLQIEASSTMSLQYGKSCLQLNAATSPDWVAALMRSLS